MSSRPEGKMVTKAMLRAAKRLGLSNKELARIVGLSESSVSRMRSGTCALNPQRKSYELAQLFIRSYLSLESIVSSDSAAMKAWLRASNSAIGGMPVARLMSVAGLTEVIAYLDARRNLV
jgi:hypothetical protein